MVLWFPVGQQSGYVSIELGNEREGIVLFRPVIGVALLPSGHWGQGGTGPV